MKENKMIYLVAVLLVFFLMIPPGNGKAEIISITNLTLYHVYTNEQFTIAWDDANVDHYSFYLWNYGEKAKYAEGSTAQTQVPIFLPRTGLWQFFIKSCNADETECSEYAHTLQLDAEGNPIAQIQDPNNPNASIKGTWLIYGHVAPPSGGGIETSP
jgi:hypothetical protein